MQCELETAERIRASAERIAEELANASTHQLARSLRRLTEQLVSDLLPSLAAEEAVLDGYLDIELRGELKTSHEKLRSLIERLEIVADGVERSRSRVAEVGPAGRMLRESVAALAALVEQLRAACCRLDASLSPADLKQVTEALEAAATSAREQTMLIVQPAIPPRASTVLRKRPDLETASALSLAAIERSSGGSADGVRAKMDTSPTPHGGRP